MWVVRCSCFACCCRQFLSRVDVCLNLSNFSENRIWECRFFVQNCMHATKSRVFPFTFAHCPSFLRTAYGNAVFSYLKLHAFDKSVLFFCSLLLPALVSENRWWKCRVFSIWTCLHVINVSCFMFVLAPWGFGRLCKALGMVWESLGCFGRGFGRLWDALGEVVEGFWGFWKALGSSGRLWESLQGFARLWEACGGFGRFLDVSPFVRSFEGLWRLWQALRGLRLWEFLAQMWYVPHWVRGSIIFR